MYISDFGSKPSQDASLRKIAIWGANSVLCSAPKFGPHPGCSYGGQGGLSFYVGAKGMQWSQISHRKLKISISHGVVILASEPDDMLRPFEVLLLCQKLLISLIELVNAYRHDRFHNPSYPRRAGGALTFTLASVLHSTDSNLITKQKIFQG